MRRNVLSIAITPIEGGAVIRLPDDKTLLDGFRACFPKAFWGEGTLSWHLRGRLAATRLAFWAAEQQAYLWRLEQRLRDRDWETAAPRPYPEAPPPVSGTGFADRTVTWRSIPSQWRTGERPPGGEPERAVAAIRELDAAFSKRELFGFLREKVSAFYEGAWMETDDNYPQPELIVRVGPEYVNGGRSVHVHWRWSAIYGGDGWAEIGWHPDDMFFAVTAAHAIWSALNPGKRHIL